MCVEHMPCTLSASSNIKQCALQTRYFLPPGRCDTLIAVSADFEVKTFVCKLGAAAKLALCTMSKVKQVAVHGH